MGAEDNTQEQLEMSAAEVRVMPSGYVGIYQRMGCRSFSCWCLVAVVAVVVLVLAVVMAGGLWLWLCLCLWLWLRLRLCPWL